MRSIQTKRWYFVIALTLTFLIVSTILIDATVQAQEPDEDDDILGGPEIGVEYVRWYGGGNDLPWWDSTGTKLYNELGRGGWTKRFIYGNRWAWEEDFKRSSMGGKEHKYVDKVDLAFFHGHGGSGWDSTFRRTLKGPVFGVGGRDHDDAHLVPGDAYHAWGNDDLEWVAMKGCQILDDRSRGYWAAAMNRLHLIMGFKTSSYSTSWGSFGTWFARYINWNYTMTQAWFKAADKTQPHHRVVARVLAEERCHFNDRRYNSCGDYNPNGRYWYWDHTAGSQPALLVDPSDLEYSMPILPVAPAPLEPGEQAEQIAAAFGLEDVPATLEPVEGIYQITDGDLDFTMDEQGLYSFINLGELWIAPTTTIHSRITVMDADAARAVADQFLITNGLMNADAYYYEVVPENLTEVSITEIPSSTITALGLTETITEIQETISQTITSGWQVIYSRIITYTPAGGDPVAFSVQGPGAKLKIYVSNEGNVIGAMGGWRPLHEMAMLDTVSIITSDQMLHLYEQLGSIVNLANTPFIADEVVVTTSTIGYYEQPMGIEQASLTPVYIMGLSFRNDGEGEVLTNTAYVPASPQMMNPLASVTSYTETTPIIAVGQVLTLTAADAAQPLSALGYGDDLNFALGEAPYTYTWYLETTDEVLGYGRMITTLASIRDDLGVDKYNDVPMSIILEVTDSAGHSTRTARQLYFADVTPVQRIYLPVLMKEFLQ